MNDNNNSEINKENEVSQITPNKELFKEIIKEANLPKEKVKQELPNLDKEWKEDTVEPIKTATDQEKINAYDNLETKGLPKKGLPFDWKDKLLRLKNLESQLSSFDQVKEELKGWTDNFSEKKPQGVAEEIKNLEEQKTKITEELTGWKETFTNQVPQEVDKKIIELGKNNDLLEENIKKTSKELTEWKQTWEGKELKEIKEEWDLLNKRPDISITEQKFYDDYARRKSQNQSKLESEKLEELTKKVEECKEKNSKLWQKIDKFLEAGRVKRYVLAKPVKTIKQAREAIAELLEETEKTWEDYFQGENMADTNLALELEIYPTREAKVRQVLEWIKEARSTLDYEKLLERWCDGSEYNKEYNFDGTLHLLKEYLEVKEFEAID